MAGIISMVITLAILGFYIYCGWQLYVKAGEPGWASIVPLYNAYVMVKFLGRPWWWLILLFVPIVSIVFAIILMFDLAKCFGKSAGFAIGLILLFPIFYPILALGDAEYTQPSAA